MSFIIKKEEK